MKAIPFRISALIIAALILAAGAGFVIYQLENPKRNLPKLLEVKNFSLIDSAGRPFGSDQLNGKIWAAQFFFTTCSGICPVITGKMASIYRSYELDDRVHFVSITVNPDNDTPDVLTQYAARFNRDPRRWHFLTGPIETIQDISVNILKVGNTEEPVFHSAYFVLVDAQGWIRGYYDGLDPKGTRQLFVDIAHLLKETSP